MFGDSFFKKVEKKTNVNKETIMSLASKLQQSNMKDENTLRELIQEISLQNLILTAKNTSLTSRKALSRVHLSARNGAKKVT